MEITNVAVQVPKDTNVIIAQSHFIKTVEDVYEALVGTVPGILFGIAFCEASGACLVRSEGNDPLLKKIAEQTALSIAAGHALVIFMKNAYPINVMRALKDVPEICTIFCATANSLEVVVAESSQGRGIIGVIDGSKPKGIEGESDVKWRKELLRKIKYKL
ncbi:MAG: adenosine-specific kinase [Candidatus Omnitrophica bacterium]|nr:adenosine-specific kinase [Candidatus Omnitrophota bacterium]